MMEWTEEHNKRTINTLLDYYADLLSRYADFVEQTATADLTTKLKTLQTLKSVAVTIDTLLRRWSFAYRGYDSNTHQARQDADAEVSERASSKSETQEARQGGSDDGLVELKILLKALPENEGEAVTGKNLSQQTESSVSPVPKLPVKKMKKEEVVAEISKILDDSEQSTAAISEKIGRSERTVRRYLTPMISEGKVTLIKKGVYRLHRSVKWTEADNREMINQLLHVYTALINVCKDDVKDGFTGQEMSDTEKIKIVKTFNACVATIDRLMKRWSLVHLGWNTNPRLAKADAEAKTHHAEKVDLENAPLEVLFKVIRHYGASMKAILFNMPGVQKKVSDDEFGVWAYDQTCQELYPPDRTQPISEADARKRLMNRKSPGPAPLIVFG